MNSGFCEGFSRFRLRENDAMPCGIVGTNQYYFVPARDSREPIGAPPSPCVASFQSRYQFGSRWIYLVDVVIEG